VSRRFRSFSKSSMLKALSAVNLERARREMAERRRWRPRLALAFLLGVVVGIVLTRVVI
jgi:hypothetical protein